MATLTIPLQWRHGVLDRRPGWAEQGRNGAPSHQDSEPGFSGRNTVGASSCSYRSSKRPTWEQRPHHGISRLSQLHCTAHHLGGATSKLPGSHAAASLPLLSKSLAGTPLNLRGAVYPGHSLGPRRNLRHAASAQLERSGAAAQASMAETDDFSKSSGYIAAGLAAEVERWEEYDPVLIERFFLRKPFLLARRLLQIGTTLGGWLGQRWLDDRLGRSEEMFQERAGQLRAALIQLGPAFVKIAQAVSSRPDVIPPAYLEELSLLQDRIAPFSTDLALSILEDELGVPVEIVFSEISPQPVAAASLGQVYQARLRPNGQLVAVKVQRPGVKAAIALDVLLLRVLAGWLRKFARLNTDLQAVVDEWASSLFREMDYQAEARNGDRFRLLFGNLPRVVVPEMYSELTTRRVLVMEWVEGERLADASDLQLVEVGVYCSLSQMLDSGFYHADPHPGNLLRTPDGRLAYLDFGMMGEIKPELREALVESCVHLVNRDFDALAKDFVSLGLLPRGSQGQLAEITAALTGVFQEAVNQGVRNISFGDLSGNLGRQMYKFKFRIPSYFSLVVRSLTVLEGIALSASPDYKVLGSSYPWIARKVLTDPSPQLRSTLKNLLFKDGELRVERLESLLRESTRPMFTFGPDGGAVVEEPTTSRVLRFALSDEGRFVREAMLDEVAKGIDAFNRAAFDASAEQLERVLPAPLALAFFSGSGLPRLLEPEDSAPLQNLLQISRLILAQGTGPSEGGTGRQLLAAGGRVGGGGGGGESDEEVVVVEGQPLLEWGEVLGLVQKAGALTQQLPATIATFAELPVAAQRAAIFLPADLAGRLLSRGLARTIRRSLPRANTGFQDD